MQNKRAPYMISTIAGIGRISPAPGTVGSIIACTFFALISKLILHFSLKIYIILPIMCVFTAAAGLWACRHYLKLSNKSDPQEVIIDEVAGQFITLYLILLISGGNMSWREYALGFGLFRAADIIKPWPICWVDKNLKGALGVMLDDVLAGLAAAGIYAGAIMLIERI